MRSVITVSAEPVHTCNARNNPRNRVKTRAHPTPPETARVLTQRKEKERREHITQKKPKTSPPPTAAAVTVNSGDRRGTVSGTVQKQQAVSLTRGGRADVRIVAPDQDRRGELSSNEDAVHEGAVAAAQLVDAPRHPRESWQPFPVKPDIEPTQRTTAGEEHGLHRGRVLKRPIQG